MQETRGGWDRARSGRRAAGSGGRLQQRTAQTAFSLWLQSKACPARGMPGCNSQALHARELPSNGQGQGAQRLERTSSQFTSRTRFAVGNERSLLCSAHGCLGALLDYEACGLLKAVHRFAVMPHRPAPKLREGCKRALECELRARACSRHCCHAFDARVPPYDKTHPGGSRREARLPPPARPPGVDIGRPCTPACIQS